MNDAGGWLWLVIDVGLVGIFGIVLAYGTTQWRRRRRDRAEVAPEYKEGS